MSYDISIAILIPRIRYTLSDRSLESCTKAHILRVNTGKPVPVTYLTRSDPTRPVKCIPDPYPTRGYGSGTGLPAGRAYPQSPSTYHIQVDINLHITGKQFKPFNIYHRATPQRTVEPFNRLLNVNQ